MTPLPREIEQVRANAQCLYTRAQVDAAFDRIASDITSLLSSADPLLLAILAGGAYPLVQIAERLTFPCQIDFAHATRYRGGLVGGAIEWRAKPRTPLAGRVVLVIDDILDEGHTLAEVMAECTRQGATRVLSAVLVRKRHPRPTVGHADFVGLEVNDRYVFGCGMDYKEYFRGLPAIYAVATP
jgi:hypoxanthine phosphoribosyltransferase